MNNGFIYLLGNRAMPGFYKIGCTKRSPYERSRQLSSPSGIPLPFDVLLYIEVNDMQRQEQRLHRELDDFRESYKREFFRFGPDHMSWLWYVFKAFPDVKSFTSIDWVRYAPKPVFPDDYLETWIDDGEYLCMTQTAPIGWSEMTVI